MEAFLAIHGFQNLFQCLYIVLLFNLWNRNDVNRFFKSLSQITFILFKDGMYDY